MAAISLTTAGRVETMKSIDQTTARAGYEVTAGDPMYIDASGNWAHANSTDATHSTAIHIAQKSAHKGEYVSGLRTGDMDGFAITGLAYNAAVYLSDAGGLADAAGTTSVVLGRVRPANAATPGGTAPDKVLRLHCPL